MPPLMSGAAADARSLSVVARLAAPESGAHSRRRRSTAGRLRRLIHSILDGNDSDPRDDATMLLIEWWPPEV
ncbi:hypothetical protein [Streptomyces sp. NPDC023838]|uniref:hypothetical protein n=1 Tax=Streptomyces sp. NPDC023838 TaxID=3154325 RepID=UPI00340D8795